LKISPVLLVTYIAAIYAIIKVPTLTSHIFTGTTGVSSGVLFDRVAVALAGGT